MSSNELLKNRKLAIMSILSHDKELLQNIVLRYKPNEKDLPGWIYVF
jgi:hypothetical protein